MCFMLYCYYCFYNFILSWYNSSNANINQLTNIKTFIKEKCYRNNTKKKNYFLYMTQS